MTFFLGLTGSIGMGKSTTAAMFAEAGVPVYDADATVHALYRAEAVAPLAEAFPAAIVDGAVERARLSAAVIGDDAAMKRLEAIVHPLVRARELAFRAEVARAGHGLAVLDIPLLFETGGERRCDAVLAVSAAPAVQRARVLARPGMTADKFEAILARQMPDAEKRRRAHFLVDTGHGLVAARRQLGSILRALAGRPGRTAEEAARTPAAETAHA